jgi:hypothetical protein
MCIKKLIAMLTIVAMLSGCGTIRKLTDREGSSTKPPEPIKTEEFFFPEVRTVLVASAVLFLSLFGVAWYLDVVFREDESSSEDKVVKNNKRSKMKISGIVKKRYASKRYLLKPNTRYTTPEVEADEE